MDDLMRRAFDSDRRRTTRRLTLALADIREQLDRVQDAIRSGKPLAAGRMRRVINLAGDAALAAGALDILTEWNDVLSSQDATNASGQES